jgi:hypothetical protein
MELLIALIIFEIVSGGFVTANVVGAASDAGRAAWDETKRGANSWYSRRAKDLAKTKRGRARLAAERHAAGAVAFVGRGVTAGARAVPGGMAKGRHFWAEKSPVGRRWRKWRARNEDATQTPDGATEPIVAPATLAPEPPGAAPEPPVAKRADPNDPRVVITDETVHADDFTYETDTGLRRLAADGNQAAARELIRRANERQKQSPAPGGGKEGEHVADTDTEKAPAVLQAWRRLAKEVEAQVEADDTNGWALPGDQDAVETVKAVLAAKEADLKGTVEGAEGTKNANAERFRD